MSAALNVLMISAKHSSLPRSDRQLTYIRQTEIIKFPQRLPASTIQLLWLLHNLQQFCNVVHTHTLLEEVYKMRSANWLNNNFKINNFMNKKHFSSYRVFQHQQFKLSTLSHRQNSLCMNNWAFTIYLFKAKFIMQSAEVILMSFLKYLAKLLLTSPSKVSCKWMPCLSVHK